jgi:hypothetical protein
MNTVEIFRTARVVIDQQGRLAAENYARERLRLCCDRADAEAADVWARIESAINHILHQGMEGLFN